MLRQKAAQFAPSLSLLAKRPLLAAVTSNNQFSTSVALGYEFIIAEKKGAKGNVGLITLNRCSINKIILYVQIFPWNIFLSTIADEKL